MRKITNNGTYYETPTFILNVRNISYRTWLKKIALRSLYPFRNLFYKLVVNLVHEEYVETKYDVVLCSIFKNEAPFLREFIEYHKLIGIDHFYLYNNFSSDNYKEILEPYINNGYVTLIEWPIQAGQIEAYNHWNKNFKCDSKWVSFLDLDEFICPVYDYSIKDWLSRYTKYPVITIDWLMFGSSGIVNHDFSGLVIEQYTRCWNKRGRIGKLFLNCKYSYISHLSMQHYLKTRIGVLRIPPFNASGNIVDEVGFQFVNARQKSIQCNHYYCKSYDILQNKISKGSAAYKTSWKKMDIYWTKEMNSISMDYKIHRFLLKLKIQMGLDNSNT